MSKIKENNFATQNYKFIVLFLSLVCIFATAPETTAQTTEFTYQGKLTDGGMSPTGNYDFEFRLYDAAAGGTLLGTQTRLSVPVSNGIFTVQLDFGAQFSGAARFLDISVKPTGSANPFTPLTPRQAITSSPYAVRSLNAGVATNSLQLGGVAANQYVLTTDGRLSDARQPTTGSFDYVQNRTTQQAATNFNVSGNGTAGGTLAGGIVRAETQYNIGNSRVLSNAGANNLFAGRDAGTANTGFQNSFFGHSAGNANTSGDQNAFFGSFAGDANTTGDFNSFFGSVAGNKNTTADHNSFFGYLAGYDNTGGGNSFFGSEAGSNNTTAFSNSFFGRSTGFANTTGSFNSFFGSSAGAANTEGTRNSFFGSFAGRNNTTAADNSFFGHNAGYSNTTGSGNSFFGRLSGEANTTGLGNSFFGRGAGISNTDGGSNSFFGFSAGFGNTTGEHNTFVGVIAGNTNTTGSNNTALGYGANVGANLTYATVVGADASVVLSNTIALGRSSGADRVFIWGLLDLNTLGAAGSQSICRNASGQIATCSSSLRYKNNIKPFSFGLNLVNRLKPITFDWKDGGMADLGLGAEEVAEVEPLLVTYNTEGKVEGIKYDRIGVVLLNAVKEQQTQIEQQQRQIDQLKRIVCALKPDTEICKETNK